MFSVRSANGNSMSEAMKESGIPTVTQVAIRRSKTRTRQINTRTMPITAFCMISENLSEIGAALSFQIDTVTAGGGS